MKKRPHQILTKDQWLKIGREYAKKGTQQLANELGVSHGRVQQIAFQLRKEGAPIPYLRGRFGLIKQVAEILKKEMPVNN